MLKKFNAAVTARSSVCPVCSAARADHYTMLNHVVGYHAALAKAGIPHRCDSCSIAFRSASNAERHKCAKKRKAEADTDGQTKKSRIDTRCCGYQFSGRLWNYERHMRTKHQKGFRCFDRSSVLRCSEVGKYHCTWPGCNEKFDRLEPRQKHVRKVHQHEDERKLNPHRVARHNHFFLYACKKGLRGKGVFSGLLLLTIVCAGGYVHVGIVCPPDEVLLCWAFCVSFHLIDP